MSVVGQATQANVARSWPPTLSLADFLVYLEHSDGLTHLTPDAGVAHATAEDLEYAENYLAPQFSKDSRDNTPQRGVIPL